MRFPRRWSWSGRPRAVSRRPMCRSAADRIGEKESICSNLAGRVHGTESDVRLVPFGRIAVVEQTIDALRVGGQEEVHHGQRGVVGYGEGGAARADVH